MKIELKKDTAGDFYIAIDGTEAEKATLLKAAGKYTLAEIFDMNTKAELQRLYDEIMAERDISMAECVFLQEHQDEIKKFWPDDPLLWQWAGIPEAEYNGKYEITKHETRDYYYIWDNQNNTELCDDDGEPYHFDTEADARDFINELEQ